MCDSCSTKPTAPSISSVALPASNFQTPCALAPLGMIPAPDWFDPQVRIYELMRSGTPDNAAEAEHIHRELLPLIVFMMSSVGNFIAYGKQLLAQRLGLRNGAARQPSIPVTDFGLEVMAHWAKHLGPLPGA